MLRFGKVISPNGASSAPNSRQDGSQMRKRSDAGSEGKPQLDWLQSAPLDCAQTVQFSLTPPRDGGELLAGSTPSATPRTTVDALEATDSNAKSGSHARLESQHAGATVASSDATEPQLPAPEVCSEGIGLAESSQWYGLTTASYVHHRQAVNAPLLDQQDARALDNNTVLGKQPHSRPQDARCAQIHMQHAGNVTDKQGLLQLQPQTQHDLDSAASPAPGASPLDNAWRTLSCAASPEPACLQARRLADSPVRGAAPNEVRYICGEAFDTTVGGGFGLPSSDDESVDLGESTPNDRERVPQRIRTKSMLGHELPLPVKDAAQPGRAVQQQPSDCTKLLAQLEVENERSQEGHKQHVGRRAEHHQDLNHTVTLISRVCLICTCACA